MERPPVTNCAHSEDGWCLACVQKVWDERQTLLSSIITPWPAGGFSVYEYCINPANIQQAEGCIYKNTFGSGVYWFAEYVDAENAVLRGKRNGVLLQEESDIRE
jgi:hypothetical protein